MNTRSCLIPSMTAGPSSPVLSTVIGSGPTKTIVLLWCCGLNLEPFPYNLSALPEVVWQGGRGETDTILPYTRQSYTQGHLKDSFIHTQHPRALTTSSLHIGHVLWSKSQGSMHVLWNICLKKQRTASLKLMELFLMEDLANNVLTTAKENLDNQTKLLVIENL